MPSKTEETVTKIAIGVGAAVTSMYVGSLFGDAGTLIGTAIGATASGGATQLYTHLAERGTHHLKSTVRTHRQIVQGIAIGAATLALGYGGLTVVEAAANKPLHAITTGSHESGTSLGGTTSNPPEPTQAPEPSASFSSPSSPSVSPSPLQPSPTVSSSASAPQTPLVITPTTSTTPTPTVSPSSSPAQTAGGANPNN